MGIVHYFGHLYRKWHGEMIKSETELRTSFSVSHLFFDFNSLIHPCARRVLENVADNVSQLEENQITRAIIEYTITYTQSIVDLIKPDNLYIYIDGVAPRAKINQQRSRRYKAHFTGESGVWNTNKITPGTKFMKELSKALYERDFGCATSISDSDVPGEGEHKMTKVIEAIDSGNTPPVICIYGLDADLIMLSLINKNADKIVLLRDPDLDGEKYIYVDIHKLRGCIARDTFTENEKVPDGFYYDYFFLCMLLGNDFLEHIPSLSIRKDGIRNVLRCYKNALKRLNVKGLVNVQTVSVNTTVLIDIFSQLARSEDYYFKNIKSKSKCIDAVENTDTVHYYTTDFVQFNKPGYKDRYYTFHGIHDRQHACEQYIMGLYWVLGYYRGHLHDNWDYYYPYSGSPFVSDLYNYCVTVGMPNNLSFSPSKPLQSLCQLFMVLPKKSLLECLLQTHPELYEKIKRIFSSGQLEYVYPDKLWIYTGESEYLWQSKPILDNYPDNLVSLLIQ
ncbi:hypothetical protein EB118_03500 [bacterium]|nr:hypothetical protein [bacterium]NDC94045.1 hypothetical protein [bacterium]NDD82731.1 hypothetical protein [bacterium]NDG29151.1 hypothetical protein [bacterium]